MGIFDFLKGKKDSDKDNLEVLESKEQMPSFSTLTDGRTQVTYYTSNNKNFYDTVLLTIGEPINLAGKRAYNCVVAWDSENACQMIDYNPIVGKKKDYKGVLLDINYEALQTDPSYAKVLMEKLLDKDRVTSILAEGLKDSPVTPCGKYIGSVEMKNGIWQEHFDYEMGMASHNSKLMVDRREKIKRDKEQRRANEIARRERKIADLKNEINELETGSHFDEI